MEENCFSFENLRVYQDARQLVVVVYRLSSKFPRTEAFALCQQLQRSIVSVPPFCQRENSFHRNCIWLFDGSILPVRDSLRPKLYHCSGTA